MTVDQTSSPSALHRLAASLGVLRQYVSAAGDTRTVADDSLRALCSALGFEADSDDAAEHALARLHASRPRLDPVLVAREGSALETVWRGTGATDKTFAWRITTEQGSIGHGNAKLQPAPVGGGLGQWLLQVPLAGIATGYHRLEIDCGDAVETSSLIVAPRRAYTPPQWQSEGRRDWSITAQLYSLRSQRNWGIGDFSDLGALARHAAALGASSIGLNPLHALFPANPCSISPYSPSSRAFLNAVYVDVEAVPEFAHCEAARAIVASSGFQDRLRAARAAEFVDYEAVWGAKLQVLRLLHAAFRDQAALQPQSERALAFEGFKAAGGAALARFATFEALQAHFADRGAGASWQAWPAAFRDAHSPAVAAFVAAHGAALEFSQYLQWEAERQLAAVAQAMREAGMTTGLYRDVAVGVDPHGAEAWGDRTLLVEGASVGAPPDIYNPNGQDWGLTPINPVALQQRAYEPFIAAIRANMRHAGAVRIDHVIGLQRLYWVPSGMGAGAGAYVSYPYEHLMAIVALESQRQRCLVVGEDLGTVPAGFRDDAAQRAILSYRVLLFERENGDGAFLPPADYPELAAAAVSTHDLPTLAGLWTGRDLEWRRVLGLYPDVDDARQERAARRSARAALVAALVAHGDLPGQAADQLAKGGPLPADAVADLIEAVHCYLAKAPCRLMLVQLEDLAGEIEQMNLPGTIDEHPNWRRKLRWSVDSLFTDPAVIRLAKAVAKARAAAQDVRGLPPR